MVEVTCHTTCEIAGAYYEKGWKGELDLPEDHPSLVYFTVPGGEDGGPKGATKAQIIEALKAKGVDVPANANKAELQAILDANQ